MRTMQFRAMFHNGQWTYSNPKRMSVFWKDEEDDLFVPETLTQFTGLLDKNGVEIYEGDILRNNFAENFIQRKYFLKAGIPPKVIFIINDIRNLPFWEGQEKDSIEVIGNIYSNPELLKEAK